MSEVEAEIEAYSEQLAQVRTALALDVDNVELKELARELENLLELTRTLLPTKAASTTTTTTLPGYVTGQQVMARYGGEHGKFYPARIIAITPHPTNPMYTVVYKSYGNTEILPAASLTPLPNTTQPPPPNEASTSTLPPPPPPTTQEEADERRKKQRTEKKVARREEKQAVQLAKTANWQSFAKKATKKGSLKQPNKSIFKTSTDPYAKVGVVAPVASQTSNTSTPTQYRKNPSH